MIPQYLRLSVQERQAKRDRDRQRDRNIGTQRQTGRTYKNIQRRTHIPFMECCLMTTSHAPIAQYQSKKVNAGPTEWLDSRTG